MALGLSMALWLACGEQSPSGAIARSSSPVASPASLLRYQVVGGSPARVSEYPATGVLLYTLDTLRPGNPTIGAMLCSGTLIAPDVVVLAAHCREPQLPAHYPLMKVNYFFSLADDVSSFGPQVSAMPSDAVRVSHIESHPQYEPGHQERRVGNADDVALVYLEEALGVTPMRIAESTRAAHLLRSGTAATIVGYGRNQDVFYSASDDGKKMVGHSSIAEVGDFELEIGMRQQDAYKCFGDSGGPTFVRDEAGDEWMVGITSRGAALSTRKGQGRSSSACRRGAIDTRLDVYLPWFAERMAAACDDGLRPACRAQWRSLPAFGP